MLEKFTRFLSLSLGVLIFFCIGCVELEQRMEITKEGGIEVDYHYVLPVKTAVFLTQIKPVMDEAQQGKVEIGINDYAWLLRHENIVEYFKKNDCKVSQFKKETHKDGAIEVSFKVTAEDYRKALLSGVFGNYDVQTQRGKITIKPIFNTLTNKMTEQQWQKTTEVCQGLKLKLTLQTPTKIRHTDGTQAKNEVSWQFDLDKNASSLRNLPVMSVTFDDIKR